VAAPEDQNETGAGEAAGPEPCSPCRGTGTVISNLGGKRSEKTCQWCDGGGTRLPSEHDAQGRFKPDPTKWDATEPEAQPDPLPEAEPEAEADAAAGAAPAAVAEPEAVATDDDPPEPEAA
jgi:hypothetical protein